VLKIDGDYISPPVESHGRAGAMAQTPGMFLKRVSAADWYADHQSVILSGSRTVRGSTGWK
jgi:hypothetical protein